MPRPGVTVELVEDAPSGQSLAGSGTAFFAGVSERSRDEAVLVQSLADYERKLGARAGGSLLHDAVNAYFSEGGGVLYVSGVFGTGALAASAAVAPYTATARGAGTWGNAITVALLDAALIGGAGAVQVVVTYAGAEVERSPVIATPEAGVSWSELSDYIALTYVTGALAPLAAVPLAGGTTVALVDPARLQVAVDRFAYELGPGQVAAPGLVATPMHSVLLGHCDANKRVALLDAPDSPDPAVVGAAAVGLASDARARYGAMFAPWASYPGPAGSVVTVPYSAVQAGLIARSDAASGNPNLAAAGINGISRNALGLSQVAWSDTQRSTLNEQGVTVALEKYGSVRTYGGRSTAGPGNLNWRWFGGARVVTAIAHEADVVGENYVLQQIDGQGVLFASFNADLKGLLLEHWRRGALYGATPEEAFSVNTGPSVNTTATIAAGEVHAALRLKTSPTAEWVHIVITKTALDRALA